MGRTKSYEPREMLERAMRLFRKKGYRATTTADLVEALGINRKSMYAEFGDKQSLFDAALAHYRDTDLDKRIGFLETETAGLAEVEQRVVFLAKAARSKGAGIGCLLCNTAVECAHSDRRSRAHVRDYIDRMKSAFRNALENAMAAGDIHPDTAIEAEAALLVSHSLGQLVLIRAKVAPEVVEAASEAVLARLRQLRVPSK